MDKKATILGTASFGAVLALVLGLSRTPAPVNVTASAAREPRRTAPGVRNCPQDTPSSQAPTATDLLGDFFGRHFSSPGEAGRFVRSSEWSLDAIVAMLPDPIDSHLDWGFDLDLEAIRRAYERTGYVLDRFWMPWTEP
ncbi:MAG TPA: hypothetical protein VFU46_13870, partial [Gemmatimonadales bacterium]|nr:hypothetical protein [Gemmatimonadales bacterium]